MYRLVSWSFIMAMIAVMVYVALTLWVIHDESSHTQYYQYTE